MVATKACMQEDDLLQNLIKELGKWQKDYKLCKWQTPIRTMQTPWQIKVVPTIENLKLCYL